jgi:hypothetical protein
VHSEKKSAAKFLHGLNRLQAFFGIFCHSPFAGGEQIRIGLVVGSANTATELMKLSQAEPIGSVDHNRVSGRNIDTGFDDGGAEQDINTLLMEISHDPFKIAFVHLAVGNINSCLWDKLL